MTTLTLPKWYDLHAHFRQGRAMAAYLEAHLRMGCAGVLAMPNTKPPVSRVRGPNDPAGWSIEAYAQVIREAGGDRFAEVIVPLYLTADTTAAVIEDGAGSGLLRACKYYPPHGTTNAEHGVPLERWAGSEVFRAMEQANVVLCIHGEQHGLAPEHYFDQGGNAESRFYREWMPRLVERHPRLRIVCEHITTREAVDFVRRAPETVAATVTPQHLLFTVGHLLQGLHYHLYCLPLVKFEEDRLALRQAVMEPGQTRFFAGTDSAPHTVKATECGCAAGCFTGGLAPQLYAMAFEAGGCDLAGETGRLAFRQFLCLNGARYYGLPVPQATFELERLPDTGGRLATPDGEVVSLAAGLGLTVGWRVRSE